MRQPELEPLSPDLVRLLETERMRPEPPDAMRSRVRERLGRELLDMVPLDGGGPPPTTAGVRMPNGRGWFRRIPVGLALLCAGGIGGAGLHALLRPPVPTAVLPTIVSPVALPNDIKSEQPAATAPAVADAHSVGSPQPRRESGARAQRPARGSPPRTAPSTSHSEESATPPLGPDGELAAERALLEQARTALARGKPADALVLLDRQARTFANGRLVEEREALVILSLAADKQTEAARRLASQFRQKHPRSMLLHAIDATLGTPP